MSETEGTYACCEIASLESPLVIEDDASFYFDTIPEIERNLKLMPDALRHALFMYQINNKIDLVYKH
jgi:hypothetical protein